MSRSRKSPSLFGRLPTILRTVRHLRPVQIGAQLRHAIFGTPRPRRYAGPTPILATRAVVTPFLDPPAHVRFDGGSQIEMLATRFRLDTPIDWNHDEAGPLFAYHLHQHEALRLRNFPTSKRADVLDDWIRHHPDGIGWDRHPISLRLICWGKLLTTAGMLDLDDAFREAMIRSMAGQAETLATGLEVRLQANHLLSNLIAVVFVGLLFEGEAGDAWLGRSEALVSELRRQIRPDGGHEERSPMYHALLLENVLDLLNLCRSNPGRVPAGLDGELGDTATRMLAALEVMTHADGRIALFADSAFEIAAAPEALRDYARRLGLAVTESSGSRHLSQTGYVRLQGSAFDLIASVAGASPPHQPGHAHCDALAFELSVEGHRLVTDTGLFEYRPGSRRESARTTSSHATLVFDGQEQSEIWSAHRVGGRARVELSAWDESGSAEATCRGWSRGAPLHRRFFQVEDEAASIVDRVEGEFDEVRFCLPFDPAWAVVLESRTARAHRTAESGETSIVEIDLPALFEWRVESRAYFPTFGREVLRPALVGLGRGTGGHSSWGEALTRFRRIA